MAPTGASPDQHPGRAAGEVVAQIVVTAAARPAEERRAAGGGRGAAAPGRRRRTGGRARAGRRDGAGCRRSAGEGRCGVRGVVDPGPGAPDLDVDRAAAGEGVDDDGDEDGRGDADGVVEGVDLREGLEQPGELVAVLGVEEALLELVLQLDELRVAGELGDEVAVGGLSRRGGTVIGVSRWPNWPSATSCGARTCTPSGPRRVFSWSVAALGSSGSGTGPRRG